MTPSEMTLKIGQWLQERDIQHVAAYVREITLNDISPEIIVGELTLK